MNDERKQQQRENNKRVLEPISQTNEYQKSIAAWRDGEHKSVSWLTRILKSLRQKKQTQSAELELFRDQFEFETGLDSRGNGKQAFLSAVRAHLQRAAEHQARRLANEERAGTIADFDDGAPMGEEPDFEAEILKQQPELKEFRK
jgi:hypothetical protein